MSNEKKKTAGERLKNLEDALLGTIKAVNGQANEQEIIKEALRLLGNKLDSVVQLLNAGQPLSDSNIASQMMQNKANKLAEDVAAAVVNGVLTPSDTIDAKSFVVCREVLDDGRVVNPRLQFTMENAVADLQPKLLGAKVLDKIVTTEDKPRLEVAEIYTINEQKAPDAPPAASTSEALDLSASPAPEAEAAPAQA